MANLKAFALNIAKQIKPDDSIECIAEIIEQQIESVWPMTHQPTVGTGQRETELRKLAAKWPHETCTICGRDFSNTERLKHGWLACCREAHPCRRCQVEAALASLGAEGDGWVMSASVTVYRVRAEWLEQAEIAGLSLEAWVRRCCNATIDLIPHGAKCTCRRVHVEEFAPDCNYAVAILGLDPWKTDTTGCAIHGNRLGEP